MIKIIKKELNKFNKNFITKWINKGNHKKSKDLYKKPTIYIHKTPPKYSQNNFSNNYHLYHKRKTNKWIDRPSQTK
jgi:hypothetical protein